MRGRVAHVVTDGLRFILGGLEGSTALFYSIFYDIKIIPGLMIGFIILSPILIRIETAEDTPRLDGLNLLRPGNVRAKISTKGCQDFGVLL